MTYLNGWVDKSIRQMSGWTDDIPMTPWPRCKRLLGNHSKLIKITSFLNQMRSWLKVTECRLNSPCWQPSWISDEDVGSFGDRQIAQSDPGKKMWMIWFKHDQTGTFLSNLRLWNSKVIWVCKTLNVPNISWNIFCHCSATDSDLDLSLGHGAIDRQKPQTICFYRFNIVSENSLAY